MSTARGGIVVLNVLDAARNSVTLELPMNQELGLTPGGWGKGTVHRLDGARFAECGSDLHSRATADELTSDYLTLCWYCFPRS